MKRKGISPLIAAVLLIAFTMAVAAILTAWVTSFTQDTTQSVGNESERLVGCSFASVDIYDAVLTEGANTLRINVANTGTRDLNNATIVVFHENGTIDEGFTNSINSGDVVSRTVNNVAATTSTLDRVRVASSECPEVSVESSEFTTS